MARIAISYRRSDTQAMSGRIFDRLVDRYGDDSVFMDIDKIPLGMDFRDHIREVLENADIVLAIVGPDWVGHRGNGTTRLADEVDPVRFEIETALTRKIPVIPVLVGDAEMPKPNELPESLKPFVYRNAATIDTGRDFRVHMDRLIGAIDQIIARIRERSAGPAPAPSAPRQPPPKTATGDPPRPVSAAANAAPAVSGASLRAWADVLIHIAAPTLIMIFLFFALGIGKAASTDSTMLIALSAICLSLSLLAGFSIYRRRHYLGGRAAAIGSAIAVIGLAVIIVTTDSRIASAASFGESVGRALSDMVSVEGQVIIGSLIAAALVGNVISQLLPNNRTAPDRPLGLIARFVKRAPRHALEAPTRARQFAATLVDIAIPSIVLLTYYLVNFDQTVSDQPSVYFFGLSILAAALAGFFVCAYAGALGARAAAIGAAIGIIVLGIARIMQLNELNPDGSAAYWEMPGLTGTQSQILGSIVAYVLAMAAAGLAGNLLAQVTLGPQRIPKLGTLAQRTGPRGKPVLIVAVAVLLAVAIGAAWIALQPYCDAFGITGFCTAPAT